MRLVLALLLAASGLAAEPLAAQVAHGDPSPHSEASLVADVAQAARGVPFDVAVRLALDPGWHTYWTNAGDSGYALRVAWDVPEGVTVGPLRFPAPERLDLGGLTSYVHHDVVDVLARVTVPEGFPADALTLTGRAEWLVCEDTCLPAEGTVRLTLPVGPEARGTGRLDAARQRLPQDAGGWTVAAARADSGTVVTVAPPTGSGLVPAAFFPAEAGVLDHAAPQAFRDEGGAWAAVLRDARDRDAPPERLAGVLRLADGSGVAVDVPVEGAGAAAAPEMASSPLGLWAALLLALGGGLLLNLMPCVFPVLSLKILGFAGGRDADRALLRRTGTAFALGVLVSFWALAGALLALRAAGEGIGWGFQLQSPLVVAALAALMTGLALNLLGVFEVGAGLASVGGRLDRGHGVGGAFASGVLATVVATPCTAPFMGAALGYALAQPPAVALAVFTALGLGMALPYVVLSFVPAWTRVLPKPGPWMETLKQALAFPLLATAVWLVWVFGRQTSVDGAAGLLLALVLLALGAWLVGRWPGGSANRAGVWMARGLAVAALAAAAALAVAASGRAGGPATSADDGWRPFDAGAVQAHVAAGTPVFVDVTAAWCLTCQVNKRGALDDAAVVQAFEDGGVVRFLADWTDRDPEITAFLDRFGRSGVPLYVFDPADGSGPVLLPEVLTPGIVLDALQARPATASR